MIKISIRKSIEEVRIIFRDGGCELLDTTYKNNKTKMKYICNCGEVDYKSLDVFLRGSRCKQCGAKKNAESRRKSFEEVKDTFDKEGCVLLEETYKNNKTPLKYICSCGNKSEIRFSEFIKGARCQKCKSNKLRELHSFSYEQVKLMFEENGCELLSNEYENTSQKLDYVCSCGNKSVITLRKFSSGQRCRKCYIENSSGENSIFWNGGKTEIKSYVRGLISSWKKDSMKASQYKCVITEGEFDVIHHLYSFKMIFDEMEKSLPFELKEYIKDHTDEELKSINSKTLELHSKYGLGICLSNEIHQMYHSIYGSGENDHFEFISFIETFFPSSINKVENYIALNCLEQVQ